jgi:PAS domain-containing protein
MLLVGLDLVATSVLFGLAQRTDRRDLVPVSAMVLGGALGSAADVAHLLAQPSTGFAPMSMVLWTGAIATLGVAPWCGRLDVFASAAPGTRPPSLTRLPHLMVGASGVLAIGVVAGDRRVDMILGVVGGALLLALVGQMALLQHENRDLYDSIVTQSDRFRALLQGSSDVIVTCTVDGRVSYVSAAVREVFGYDPEGSSTATCSSCSIPTTPRAAACPRAPAEVR